MRSEAPDLRVQLTLRMLLVVVAVVAVILALFVANARIREDWAGSRLDDIVDAVAVTVVETVFVYYCIFATVVVRRMMGPVKRRRRVNRLLVYGPFVVNVVVLTIVQILDDIDWL